MSITITGNDLLFKACNYTSLRYVSNLSHMNALSYKKYDDRDDKCKETMFILPLGKTDIEYKTVNLSLDLVNHGLPLESQGCNIKYLQMITVCNKDNNSYDIIKDYLEHCKKIYMEEILSKQNIETKITSYIWDDYWEVFNKKSKRSLKSLCFSNNLHTNLFNDIKTFLLKSTEEEYLDYGIPYKYNILLEGYPGTGKSSLIHALASELNMSIATITFDPEMTDLKFMKALKRLPEDTIVSLEDLDVLFKKRKENEINSSLTFSGLLNILDGPGSLHKQIIIMTTNYCCNLDSALKRPGRIDNLIHFDYADKAQIELIFKKFYKKENGDDIFKKFWIEIRHLKLTTAILQGFLFRYRNDNIFEHLDELKKTASQNKYDAPTDLYS